MRRVLFAKNVLEKEKIRSKIDFVSKSKGKQDFSFDKKEENNNERYVSKLFSTRKLRKDINKIALQLKFKKSFLNLFQTLYTFSLCIVTPCVCLISSSLVSCVSYFGVDGNFYKDKASNNALIKKTLDFVWLGREFTRDYIW